MLILHVLASNFLINTCPVHVILKQNIECYLNLTMISVLLNIYQPYFSAANLPQLQHFKSQNISEFDQ